MLLIQPVDPNSAAAREILAIYFRDIVSRYHGRAISDDEFSRVVADEPADDLTGDTGALLLCTQGGIPIACAGVRYYAHHAELTKVFTLPEHRGSGIATRLISGIEGMCLARGLDVLKLDTRSDLAEACALYERLGFEEVQPFNDSPHSDRWYSKALHND
ncbi:GNAT family N-acetyltransferase [Agromyces soli]